MTGVGQSKKTISGESEIRNNSENSELEGRGEENSEIWKLKSNENLIKRKHIQTRLKRQK